MKVLFVCSGNSKFGISPIVKNQGESLLKAGIKIEYFPIIGKGISGYLKNIIKLRNHIIKNKYDLIHSHFFLSSVVASLSNAKRLIVSLMGSDAYRSSFWVLMIKIFYKIRWDATIVKSESMKKKLRLKNIHVIPNGVHLDKIYPIDINVARNKIGLVNYKEYILFASNPDRPEKNFSLALNAVDKLLRKDIELLTIFDLPYEKINFYLNASNVLLLTSLYEGSPNIIKEAMACNCPIVSTDVGDVKELIGNTGGCYIVDYDPQNVASKLRLALEFSKNKGRTNGRKRIESIGLDASSVANKIIDKYKQTWSK